MTVRLRRRSILGISLLSLTMMAGCFGTPFDKGDASGTGTGRPAPNTIDMGKTGGLGSPRGNATISPGELGPRDASAPGVGPK